MTTFPVTPSGTDHVLVASPNAALRRRILNSLPKVRRVEQANGGAEALVHLESGAWRLLLLDRRLPDLDAEELSQTVRDRYPAVEVVLLDGTDEGDPSETNAALAEDGLGRYGEGEPRDHVSEEQPWKERSGRCGPDIALPPALPGMVGSSPSIQAVYHLAKLVGPRNTTVLITGPTGSGKEVVARAVHELSPRAARSFTVVNCTAIPETLLEAELFGYSRGAFTGALQSYAGRIQASHLGTLFLDEIGDMPLTLQPKLLRFLEQKELQRLGSSQVVRVDTRVIAATNADLLRLVREGRFREDLYYRLSAFPIDLPPLSDRPDDIALLAAHFLERLSPGHPKPVLSEEAAACLQAQRWPGNVRELQNVIERALIMADGAPVIGTRHLMLAKMAPRAGQTDIGTPSSGEVMRAF